MRNFNANKEFIISLFLIMVSYYCSSQVGVRNAFDTRNINNITFDVSPTESNNDNSVINGNPFLTPLINGFRYNAYLDEIVDSKGKVTNVLEVKLGDYLFIKKKFYTIWNKKSSNGYLIDVGEESYIRIQKIIRNDYNPRMNNKSNKRFEEKITYYRQIGDKIKQVKKNEFDKAHFFIQLGYIQSALRNYSSEGFKNRNSVYFGLGRIFHVKKSIDLIGHFFYSKNGGYQYYGELEENGKKIILYNTIGLEFLLRKELKKITLFTGPRTNFAFKREQRKASRRFYGFRFRDEYTSLENSLKKILPLGATIGFSFILLESINFEVKYNRGISVLSKNNFEKTRLNSLQTGLTYRF